MSLFSQLRGVSITFALLSLFGCRRLHKEPFEKVPLIRGQLEAVRLSETPTLAVERLRFWSGEMNEPRFFLALVPKTVQRPNEVFILNHGWFDRPEDLLKHLHVDQVYAGMLERREVRPAIVVIPDVRFKSFYAWRADRYPFPNYLTLVAEEVAGTVSVHYRIPFERTRWGIGGFSFGGYLSLDVGRRYPGRFASVSVISGLVDSQWSYWPAEPPPPGPLDERGRGKHTIVAPGPAPRLFLACGTDDKLYRSMLHLHEALRIPHVWQVAPGGHTWKYWSSILSPMLSFHLGVAP